MKIRGAQLNGPSPVVTCVTRARSTAPSDAANIDAGCTDGTAGVENTFSTDIRFSCSVACVPRALCTVRPRATAPPTSVSPSMLQARVARRRSGAGNTNAMGRDCYTYHYYVVYERRGVRATATPQTPRTYTVLRTVRRAKSKYPDVDCDCVISTFAKVLKNIPHKRTQSTADHLASITVDHLHNQCFITTFPKFCRYLERDMDESLANLP